MDGGLLGFLSFTSLLSSLVKFIGSSLNLLLIVTAPGNEELDICHFFLVFAPLLLSALKEGLHLEIC